MINLSDLSKLNTLPLPPLLKTYLTHHLIDQPFDNLIDAKQFWQETLTQLILLEPQDQIQQLKSALPSYHLHQLTHFPEYIQKAPDKYFLSLIITGQAGGGYYLLFPDNIEIEALQQLKRIAD